jgi:hypothetical protein
MDGTTRKSICRRHPRKKTAVSRSSQKAMSEDEPVSGGRSKDPKSVVRTKLSEMKNIGTSRAAPLAEDVPLPLS